MNKFEKLIFEGKYDELLEETKNLNNLDEAYARFKVLVMTEKYQEVLDLIAKYKNDFIFTLNKRKELFVNHMYVLFRLNKFNEMYKEIEYYDSLPYEDYEFEEIIKEYKTKFYNNMEKLQLQNENTLLKIEKALMHPTSIAETLMRIDELRYQDFTSIFPAIKEFLKSDFDDLTKTYLLLVLVEKNSFEEIELHKNGLEYKLLPYDLDPPFENDYHKDIINLIQQYAENPSVSSLATRLLSLYTLNIYPDDFFDFDKNDIVVSFLELAAEALHNEKVQEKKLEGLDFNRSIVDAIKEEANEFQDESNNIIN
ncbi:MAG: hypothetical protein ACI311_00900 [Bacilli bacterium]